LTVQTTTYPIGSPVPNWQSRPSPSGVVLTGSHCRLEPLNPTRHTDELFTAYSQAPNDGDWTYLSVGPFRDDQAFRTHVQQMSLSTDPFHFAVIDLRTGLAVGTLALMRHQPQHGVVEVGCVTFSTVLQRSRTSTEAQFLLMSHVFDQLGYRRYEWKCDSLNRRSRNAAERLGFQYEGTFRQAIVYKGRNRDTAWFSILDKEWAVVKAAFEQWLGPQNFDPNGCQVQRLQDIRERIASSGSGQP